MATSRFNTRSRSTRKIRMDLTFFQEYCSSNLSHIIYLLQTSPCLQNKSHFTPACTSKSGSNTLRMEIYEASDSELRRNPTNQRYRDLLPLHGTLSGPTSIQILMKPDFYREDRDPNNFFRAVQEENGIYLVLLRGIDRDVSDLDLFHLQISVHVLRQFCWAAKSSYLLFTRIKPTVQW